MREYQKVKEEREAAEKESVRRYKNIVS